MICGVCGNNYDKAFQASGLGRTMASDGFECAFTLLRRRAPTAIAR